MPVVTAPSPAAPVAVIATAHGGDILDVRHLFLMMLRGWWIILAFAAVGGYNGLKALRGFSPVYEATMIVAPGGGSQQSGAAGALSTVTRTLGIQIAVPQSEATSFDRLRLLVGSPQFVAFLDEKYSIIRRTFAGSWDDTLKVWTKPTGRRFEIEQRVNAALHLPTWREPSLESFASYLKSSVTFVRDPEQPMFFTITYRNVDRDFAAWLLQTVYLEGDNYLRNQDRLKTEERIGYIVGQLASVQNIEFRVMFQSMLAEQERNLMLLSASAPYAADIAQPVYVSAQPTAPDLVKDFGVVLVGWTLAGAMLVLVIGMVRRPQAA